MYSYVENYGQDIDGNRGMLMRFYELEDSDSEEIIKQLKEDYPDGDYPDSAFVKLYDNTTDKLVDIEIQPKDYYGDGFENLIQCIDMYNNNYYEE